LQAGKAGGNEAFSPQSYGLSIAVEFGGDVLVGGSVLLGSPENKTAAEGECLGRGAGLDQGVELFAILIGQDDG
jgi:hypothetical protein